MTSGTTIASVHRIQVALVLISMAVCSSPLEAQNCDFNSDNLCDADDMDLLYGQGELVGGASFLWVICLTLMMTSP